MESTLIWTYLIHLSYNMWADRDLPEPEAEHVSAKPYLRFDLDLWNELEQKMADAGINMVVIDLGDGIRYQSHPEIAVRGAWMTDQLKQEVTRLRRMGIEPIPKLNFSTAHDAWLGPYSRCVSTDTYYAVCRDLIAEVIEIFDRPRFFHLGMDEETAVHQRNYEYLVVRQFDLWWRDLSFFTEQVEKGGSRAWVWSDYLWHHPEMFWRKMPKSVLQSNWYYGGSFSESVAEVEAYVELDSHGYDQIPTGSNWSAQTNFEGTVDFCVENIAPERLLGFLQTVWRPTLKAYREQHIQAIEQVARAKSKLEKSRG